MSTHINPVRHYMKALLIGRFLVVLMVFMASSAVMAQGITGAGTIFRTDGTKGHFLVGSFNSEAACQEKVLKVIEYLKDQAQWAGESLTYRIHGCGTEFQKGTVYNDLKNISGMKHYILMHPNFRMMIVSPQGKAAEENICSELTGYFKNLLGKKAVCIPPSS